MSQKYENIMVAVDGSREAELAFEKGVNVALRNGSKLTLAHVLIHVPYKVSLVLMPRCMKDSKQKLMNY